MKFVSPEFLYALGFLAVPILIHLFNFRRYKTIKFSQVKFLKSIKQETQSTSKLKHFLILLSRCLAITAIVFAFAQPFLPLEDNEIKEGKRGVAIYIDNSFSMQVEAENGSLIALAKERALAIVKAYQASDKFHILSNDFKGKNQRWLNQEQAILAVQEINTSPIFRTLKEICSRMNQLQDSEELVRKRFLISDLQKNSFQLEEITDTNEYSILPIQNRQLLNNNLSDVNFALPYHLPKQQESINIKIQSNRRSEENKVNSQLYTNDQLKSPFSIELSNQDSIMETINYIGESKDNILGVLAIKDYPVTFDDSIYFNYSIQQKIKVFHIYEDTASTGIQALLANDSLIDYKTSDLAQIDFEALAQSSFVILDELSEMSSGLVQELLKFNTYGGSIALFPKSEMNLESINSFLKNLSSVQYVKKIKESLTVRSINNQSELFKGVFEELPENLILPKVKEYWKINSPNNALLESVLSYSNLSSFLSKVESDGGRLYISSVGVDEKQSNLSNHAIFVPILFNMALQSVNASPIYYQLNDNLLSLPNLERKESPIHIVGNGIDVIPPQQWVQNRLQLKVGNLIHQAGHYQLVQEGNVIQNISFNYNRKESLFDAHSPKEIKENGEIMGLKFSLLESNVESIGNSIQLLDKGTALWKYFITLALIFLGIEIALLRLLN